MQDATAIFRRRNSTSQLLTSSQLSASFSFIQLASVERLSKIKTFVPVTTQRFVIAPCTSGLMMLSTLFCALNQYFVIKIPIRRCNRLNRHSDPASGLRWHFAIQLTDFTRCRPATGRTRPRASARAMASANHVLPTPRAAKMNPRSRQNHSPKSLRRGRSDSS